MDNTEYVKWLNEKTEELANTSVKHDNEYDEEIIREYLIFSSYAETGDKLLSFFKQNLSDEKLLKMLLKILLDESEEYSNDARYSAAGIISLFNGDILKKYKKELCYAQNYSIYKLRPFPKNKPDWLYE